MSYAVKELFYTLQGEGANAGRPAVFSSDCGPPWGPPEFVAWSCYPLRWRTLVAWLARRR